MDSTRRRTSQKLQLDGIPLNMMLAKKLPPRLAFGYHVLPLAVEKNQVTIAMADPENAFAVEAVRSVFGATPYIVKSDQSWIDKLLGELWPDYHNEDLNLLFYKTKDDASNTFNDYSNYIRTLLKVPGSNIYTVIGVDHEISSVVLRLDHEINLVILEENVKSHLIRSIVRPRRLNAKVHVRPSVWVARQPRWPIDKILLILGCESRDHVAVDWILKMALPDKAVVTMLVSLPSVPRMYQGLPEMTIQIPEILKGKSGLGVHLRSLISRFESHGIDIRLHIIEGVSKWVIQQEVIKEDFDLVAIAAESENTLKRMLTGCVLDPVLDFAKSPIFIAQPLTG